jgi:beta-lactamase regulating signal transducer with metallopeptidase domain
MNSFVAIVASNALIAAVLALVTVIVTRCWRSPQIAHGLWLLVLLKLITPPLVTVSPPGHWFGWSEKSAESTRPVTTADFISSNHVDDPSDPSKELPSAPAQFPEPNRKAAASPDAVENAHAARPAIEAIVAAAAPTLPREVVDEPRPVAGAWDSVAVHGLTAASIVWIAGSLVYFSLFVWRCVRFRRLLADSAPADNQILVSAARLALQLGLRRRHTIRTVDAAVPPLVWSLGLRPLIVLPQRLLAELSPAQCEALLAHELAHVRRRDDLVRWLEVFALVLWWWNPVAWFARRKLREAEEECCDAWVVWALPHERRSYGEAMLATIDFLTGGPRIPALAESAFGTSFCKRRIEMIMKRNVNRTMSWAALGFVVLTAMAVLPIVAQTIDSNGQAESTRREESSTTTEAGPGPDAVTADTADAPHGAPKSTDAVSNAALAGETDKPASSAAAKFADRPPSMIDGLAPSDEEILKRISRLENLLQALGSKRSEIDGDPHDSRASGSSDSVRNRPKRLEELHPGEESPRTGRRGTVGGSSSSVAAGQVLPSFDVSPDEREQELQERLLRLDGQAAVSELEQARIILEKAEQINKNRPGTVSDIEVAQHRAAVRAKEIQVQRAEIVLQLFKQQAQRTREESARRRRYQQESRQQTPDARTKELMTARVKAQHTDELARLREQTRHVAKELERLENLLKEAPASPETWEAVNRFLGTYRKLNERGVTEDTWPREGNGQR